VSAAIWRRFAAITYDAFLLAALWMTATMAMTLVAPDQPILSRLVLFGVGFAFFGWFWTHGGQTLGMRAWRLRVARLDGAPLRAATALLRYMAGLLPIVAALYAIARVGWIGAPIALAGFVPCFFDRRKRALHDLIAGTELRSTQGAQAQERDENEQERRQSG
jgi:uncharacterized RDD family membrane protein YckC